MMAPVTCYLFSRTSLDGPYTLWGNNMLGHTVVWHRSESYIQTKCALITR